MFWPISTLPVQTWTWPFSSMCSHAARSGVSARPCGRARPDSCASEIGRRDHHDQAAAEEPHEVAALELERVAARLGELVAFGFDHSRRLLIAVLPVRIRSAASRTACTMRGYVPQRQTLRSISRAMSASDGLGFVFSRPTVAMTMPGRAVAALEGLDVEERLLHRMQAIAPVAIDAERLDRRDRLRADAADARDARARARAVEQHRAGAALPFAAAEAAAGQAEVVAEDGQEAVAGLGVNLAVLAIDAQDITSHMRNSRYDARHREDG